jgi:hypothetical protein
MPEMEVRSLMSAYGAVTNAWFSRGVARAAFRNLFVEFALSQQAEE